LSAFFDGHDATELERLNTLLARVSRPHGKSRRLARWLSTLVPGSGQIYAGNFGDGLNALCVNLLFGLPLSGSLRDSRYFEVTAELPQFLRYYEGNRDNAGKQVDRYNDRLNRRYAEKVIELLKTMVH